MSAAKEEKRKRLHEIIEVGEGDDLVSRVYDLIGVLAVIVFLVISILATFDSIQNSCSGVLDAIETVLVIYFTIDYVLRLYTAKYQYPEKTEGAAVLSYVFSFAGLVDLLSFLPYYLPFFFPAGFMAFRMFRVVRIFRLFRISKYYDSLNVITEVLSNKKQQLLSAVFVVLVLMLASSLCMYSVEHAAQPDVFQNAFSGIWWSVSTLLTVGYGDIYPITTLGKILGTIITFLGVGMVAIPTGIISAGFVEEYAVLKKRSEFLTESDVMFVKVRISEKDLWRGKELGALGLPRGLMPAAVLRGGHTVIPREDVVLEAQDIVVLGAAPASDGEEIDLKEWKLSSHNPWIGKQVRDLDISRRSMIFMIKRGDKAVVPHGSDVFEEGDTIYMYTEDRMPEGVERRI